MKLRLKIKNSDGLSYIKDFFNVISLNFSLRIYEYQRHLIYWYLTFYIDLQSLVLHSKSVIIFSIMYFYSTIHKHFINNKRVRPSKLQLTWKQPQSSIVQQNLLSYLKYTSHKVCLIKCYFFPFKIRYVSAHLSKTTLRRERHLSKSLQKKRKTIHKYLNEILKYIRKYRNHAPLKSGGCVA